MKPDQSRRDFVKKAAYTAPAVLTLAAVPSFAGNGSGRVKRKCNNGFGNGPDGCTPGSGRGRNSGQDDR